MKILIVPLLLLFLSGCLPFTDAAGAYSSVSVREESVIAAAEFAVAAQQGVMNEQAHSTPIQLTLLKLRSARQQVVAGMNYNLRLKVEIDGDVRGATAIVWHQAWRTPEPYQLTHWKWE